MIVVAVLFEGAASEVQWHCGRCWGSGGSGAFAGVNCNGSYPLRWRPNGFAIPDADADAVP